MTPLDRCHRYKPLQAKPISLQELKFFSSQHTHCHWMLANVCLQLCAGDVVVVCFEGDDELLHGVSCVGFVVAMG